MTILPRMILSSCLGMLALGSSWVHAQGGEIEFVGAVVEPTCGVSPAQLAGIATPQTRVCAGAASSGPDASAARTYALTVRTLPSDDAGDRLLAYFRQNLLAADVDAHASLVTQTYE